MEGGKYGWYSSSSTRGSVAFIPKPVLVVPHPGAAGRVVVVEVKASGHRTKKDPLSNHNKAEGEGDLPI